MLYTIASLRGIPFRKMPVSAGRLSRRLLLENSLVLLAQK
jgi:hypothetical protein